MKIRVCHIGFNYFPGQGLTIFYELARHQAKLGIDVSAIAPGRPGEAGYEVMEGVKVTRVPLRSIGRFSLDRLRFLREAAKIIKREPFNIVHTYAFVGAGLLPVMCHGSKAKWLYDCQTGAIKPPLLKVQNTLINWEASCYDIVTVISSDLQRRIFATDGRVKAVIPLGADFDHFQPRPPSITLRQTLGIPQDALILTYCGSLDHNRRLERLLAAFEVAHRAERKAVLLLIGGGSALGDLQNLARKIDLEGSIIFTGPVPYCEVPVYLGITTIALAFVVIEERFQCQPPTKTVEYLAQGLPVIATNTVGNQCFVKHGINGLLSGDSPEAFGHAMVGLLRDTELRTDLSARARDSVADFEWGRIVRERVLPVYREALGLN